MIVPRDGIVLRAGALTARIAIDGAELVSLAHDQHGELMWQGDPRHWAATSPILFPVVGRSSGDVIRVQGRAYPMPLHGFAAARRFVVAAVDETSCRLVLEDDDTTRAHYPFAFSLTIACRLDAQGLSIAATVANPGSGPMPFGFGFHPGFRWPLPGAPGRDGHWLDFGGGTELRVLRGHGGLIAPDEEIVALEDGRLRLGDGLFAKGAMVMAASPVRELRFVGTGASTGLAVRWSNLPSLALWSRPGAEFICIEPWQSHADVVGFDDELTDRPGIRILAPGASAEMGMRISPIY